MSKHIHVKIEESTDDKIRDLCKRPGDLSFYGRAFLEAGLKYRETTEIKPEENPTLTHFHITVPNALYKKIKKLCIRRGDLSWIVRELLLVGLTVALENVNEKGTSEDNNNPGEED